MRNNFDCDTKYPLFFVHGMGFRDGKICYWGRIPKILEKHGSSVYFGFQDANASIEENAAVLKNSLKKILDETGAEKVNIIAHSKGGIDSRYMISTLGMAKNVATLTTISSPHNGSAAMDKLMKLPKSLLKIGCWITDIIKKLEGDSNPDTYRCLEQVTASYMTEFNKNNPDSESVYYRSYSFVMKNFLSDIIMSVPYIAVKVLDGKSDGLLTPNEAKWGDFRGIYTGTGRRGISHPDEVDLRRRNFSRKEPESEHEISDITEFYVKIVSELKGMGY